MYKTTNLINGKVYYGAHKTENENDSYLGSGTAIQSAIRKYGRSNFRRDILKIFDSEEEMYYNERMFINESVVGDPNTYNQTIGGRGGFSHVDNYGDKNPMKRYDTVSKLVANRRSRGTYHTEKVKSAQLQSLRKATEINTGKRKPDHSRFMAGWSTTNWENNREGMRDAMSSKFQLTSPSGEVHTTNRLQDFCKVNNLPYTTIWGMSKGHPQPNRGRGKGWFCMKVV